ncbi:MAG: site-specific recombinase XerC [Candidatus Endobugula sp.]|jgi:site-specific recombinase XerC
MQKKTSQAVQFTITQQTRESLSEWIAFKHLIDHDYLFPSRSNSESHISTRQYERMVKGWGSQIGLLPNDYGTHALRRTKATPIDKSTKNVRAIPFLYLLQKVFRCKQAVRMAHRFYPENFL